MDLKRITEFFNQRVFSIPNYQRGYSWKSDHVMALIKDIDHAIQLKKDHYMGTITLHNLKKEESIGLNSFSVFHVVDGQQRFTTLIIILKVLIDRLSTNSEYESEIKLKTEKYFKKNEAYLFRYEIDDVNNHFFRSEILKMEPPSTDEKNAYTVNLRTAKKVTQEFLQNKSEKYCLEFLRCIEDRLKFNEYLVESVSEIGIVFETINNRGVALSTLELVKNRLLYLSSKIESDVFEGENERDRLVDLINKKWSHILSNLTLSDRVLDEDTFLTNFWIIYYGYDPKSNAKDDILNNRLTIESMLTDPQKIKDEIKKFIESLAAASRYWKYINDPLNPNSFAEVKDEGIRESIRTVIVKLNRLNTASVRPLLLTLSHMVKEYSLKMAEITALCEIFSFRLYEMNYRRSDTGQVRLFNRAKELYNNKNQKGIDNAINSLKYLISDWGTWKKFEAEISDLFNSDKKSGYYNWKGLVYCLYEYEDFKRDGRERKVTYEEATKKKNSIEHIYPQSPDDEYWLNRFGFESDEHRKKVMHSLGNLLLLDSPTNSSIGNLPYKNKRDRFANGTYSANEVAFNFKEWSPKSVLKRERLLLDFIQKRWQFDQINQETYYGTEEPEEELI